MLSSLMMKILIVEYIIVGIVCLLERDYPTALYWGGATMLTSSIVWGMK